MHKRSGQWLRVSLDDRARPTRRTISTSSHWTICSYGSLRSPDGSRIVFTAGGGRA
jgi:hypothetical protein